VTVKKRLPLSQKIPPTIGSVELCRLIGRHHSAIPRLVANGVIPQPILGPHNSRGKYTWLREDIERWLANRGGVSHAKKTTAE
jgi:hypothetical protein